MQQITTLSCEGFRGFQREGTLRLAIPDGQIGSGLTVLVGPNGGGKSTLIDAFRKLTHARDTSFTEGKRNHAAGGRVKISVTVNGKSGALKTVAAGGSETEWQSDDGIQPPKVFFLPSRRVFNPYFGKGHWSRDAYMQNVGEFQYRGQSIDNFSHRLFKALDRKDDFAPMFRRIYGRNLDWTIDQNDQGGYYVKVTKPSGAQHNSDGLGEGIISLLFIVDALYDSADDEILVIDEPELSLHPQLQRRLLAELIRLSATRQIVVATHSPEMVSVPAIINGMEVSRVVDGNEGSVIYRLDEKCRPVFQSLETDLFNPHTVGYESRACLFAEDRIIITEGQEDVVFFGKMASDLGIDSNVQFWGFGAGGSGKITKIAAILKSLGFEHIGAIYDGDKAHEAEQFRAEFIDYKCWVLPADDIRDKTDAHGDVVKMGIFGINKKIKPQFENQCRKLLQELLVFVNG